MCYDLGEHVGRDLRPFLHTESFQIFDILHLLLWTSPLQFKPQVFNGVQVLKQNVDFVVN